MVEHAGSAAAVLVMEDANSVTFVLEDEDHSLANSICYFLNKVIT